MDPLSFTASLLTVTGLGVSVATNLEKLRHMIRDAPSTLSSLIDEIKDLRLVLTRTEEALREWEDILKPDSSPVSESDAMRVLRRAEAMLQGLDQLVASCLVKPEDSGKQSKLGMSKLLYKKAGDSNIALVRWARKQDRGKTIQMELQKIKHDLNALLGVYSSYVQPSFCLGQDYWSRLMFVHRVYLQEHLYSRDTTFINSMWLSM